MKHLAPLCFVLLLGISIGAKAQGGNTCAAAMANPITTLPFNAAGSTCNGTDDINNLTSNCTSVSSIYTTGPDWFYYFCAPSTQQVSISLSNINPCPAWSSISVYSGCPNATNCIAGNTSTACTQGLTFNAVQNQCYFIMIDNWPTPACFGYTIDIQGILPPPCNPQCTNPDFESGGWNGWYGTWGTISMSTPPAPTPIYNQQGVGLPSAQHTMMTGPGLDLCGNFPVVCPGGNFSVMLGNGQTTGYGGGTIEQTFVVSPTTSSFQYSYAVVVQDASHTNQEQPFFRIDVYDAAGNPIQCGQYLVVGGPNIPNFFPAACSFGTYYRPWTTVNIDFSAYIGQCVTIRFTVGDCSQGGHFGYAYVDASCSPMQIIGNDTICPGGSSQICAPPGGGTYLWNPTAATTQCITVSPTVTTVYSCVVSSISNPNCFTTLYDTVYVVPGPLASFTAAPNPGCAGGVVTITNTTTGPATTWTWIWGDASPNSNLQNPVSHNYANSGTYTITLIASNGYCSDTVTQVVTLLGNPVVANATATAVCLNQPTVFTDLTTGTPTSWQWNFGDNSPLSNLQNPTHTYGSPGQYTVTLVTHPGNPACADTFQLVVTVHPLPQAQFIATTVCVGQPTVFTDQSTISSGTITGWSWNFGDPPSGPNNTSTLQNPTHVYTAAGNYNVVLTVTSNNGCQNTVNVQVTVYPLPVAAFQFVNVCTNNPMSFTDQSTGAAQWSWNFGDPPSGPNNTSTSQNPTHTYTTPGNYTVTLTVTSQGNCTASLTQQVTVFPGPTPQFIATTVCVGNPTVFTDQSTVANGNITNWSWNFGDNSPANTTQSPTHTYALAGTYTVTLTVTSNNGCTASSTLQVIVNPLPNTAFTATSVCVNSPTQFTDQSTIASGTITQWAWNFGDPNSGPNNTSTQQNPTHIFSAAGNYTVSLVVTSSAGCVDSASITVTVNPLPVPLLTANDTDGCAQHCVQFTDLSTVTTGTITGWLWDFGDGTPNSTAQNPSHCFDNTTQSVISYTITLTVTTSAGCVSTVTIPSYIDVYPIPVASASATPSVTTVLNTNIQFTDLSIGNPVQWFWDFGDGSNPDSTQNPSHVYPDENDGVHTYTVTLTIVNQWGCTSSTTLDVIINPEFTFYAPNCVTPNGDGVNEFFFTYGVGWKEYKLMIFDRWGDLIWWTEDMNKGWDAKVMNGPSKKLVQEDVYVWKVVLTDVFDKRHTYIGHVSVIR